MSRLLLDEPPLVLQKSLAVVLGLNEAILIQQIHYWTTISEPDEEGNVWVVKSQDDLEKAFPFWSKKTISRITTALKNREILTAVQAKNWNRTYKYMINYGQLEADTVRMHADKLSAWKETDCPDASGQPVRIRCGQLVPLFNRDKNTTAATGDHPQGASGQYEGFDYLNWEPDDRQVQYLKRTTGLDIDENVLVKFRMYAMETEQNPRTLGTRLTGWLQSEKLTDSKATRPNSKKSVTQSNQNVVDELMSRMDEDGNLTGAKT